MAAAATGSALIVGASRGLGLGLATELIARGWHVTATARGRSSAGLDRLEGKAGDRLVVETVDIAIQDQVEALRARLDGKTFDLLFVVAGIGTGPEEKVATSSLETFVEIMTTNAYWPVRFAEAFAGLVTPSGTIALMSSQLGSLGRNFGGYETYRASKASLNMLTLAASSRWGAARTVLLVHPGWVRTDMGGPDAPLDLATSVTGMADTLAARAGKPGVTFVDWENRELPW